MRGNGKSTKSAADTLKNMLERRWVVKKDGKPMASGTMDTLYPDDMVRDMYNAGYKTHIDGKLYRPKKEAMQCQK